VTTVSRRLLAGAIAALTLILGVEWLAPSGGPTPTPSAALRLGRGTAKTALVARATTEWANSILARPLFSSNRKPPKLAAGAHDEAAPEDARLAGILIGRFGRRAIFAPAAGGKPLVLGENGAVNESTIKSIEPDQVVLANGTVLKPSFDKNRVATAYTPPFQPAPFQPAPFQNQITAPGTMVGGNGPQPGFPLPRFAQPVPQQPVQPATDGDNTESQPAPPQTPVFRGPMTPNRRE
jgi:hypothetical protein